MKMLSSATAVLLVCFAALAQSQAKGTRLKNADLARTFVSGAMVVGESPPQGLSLTRLFLRGGILHSMYADPDGSGDYVRGQWRIDRDTLCTTWVLGMGQELCSAVYKLPDGTFEAWVNGSRFEKFRLIPPPVAGALTPPG